MGGQVHHQRAPMQQAARQLEVFDQQLDLDFGDHQAQVATINRCDLPLGQIGLGHELKFLTQCRREELAEIIAVFACLQAVLESLLARIAKALQVGGLENPQCFGAVFLDAPAKLFLHHETIEQDDVRGQFADEGVETAVVQLDRYFTDTQRRQVGPMFAAAGRAAECDVPALLQEAFEDLHHMPASRRRAGLGPDVTNNQDFGCVGLTHEPEFLETSMALER
ncbi:hypothetical protein D3C76_1131460 [compost metagenome]